MMFASIARCIKQSHGTTHSGWSMEVVDVLQVQHSLINRRFEKWLSVNNHQLLWHGTRKTNLGGILQHGLRIAPSEISSSGQVVKIITQLLVIIIYDYEFCAFLPSLLQRRYMFGRGIYLTEVASKAALYCHATAAQPYGYLVLARVALGNELHVTRPDVSLESGSYKIEG